MGEIVINKNKIDIAKSIQTAWIYCNAGSIKI